jgi:hypothetical protein
MKIVIVVVSLSLLSLFPQLLGLLHLFVNGGQQWSMVWSNEAIAWSAIFSPITFIALILSVKNEKIVAALIPVFTLMFILSQSTQLGSGQSSKSDSHQLQLIEFWTEQWHYW